MADVSGNDILSYRGDPALSSGSSTGTGFADNGAAALNQGTQQMLGNALRAQQEWNAIQLARAYKDRDDNYALFAQQDLDFPVLDQDRPELDSKITEIKNMMIEKPNIKADKAAYFELQKKIGDLRSSKAAAKTRYATAATQQQAIASELNPDLKKRMQESLDQQIAKGVNHSIDPYSQVITYDEKDLQADKSLTTYRTEVITWLCGGR